MKLKTQLTVFAASLITALSTVAAHSEEDPAYGHMMWSDGSWTHNAGHMAGYNMWGMGWFGLIFGLAFWILVILGLIFLYQQVTEDRSEE